MTYQSPEFRRTMVGFDRQNVSLHERLENSETALASAQQRIEELESHLGSFREEVDRRRSSESVENTPVLMRTRSARYYRPRPGLFGDMNERASYLEKRRSFISDMLLPTAGVLLSPAGLKVEKMDYVKFFCVTGDVSSLNDPDSSHALKSWAKQVSTEIWEQKPDFAAVHLQGLISGEDNENFCTKIEQELLGSSDLKTLFQASRTFFDLRETGLGYIYLIRNPRHYHIWNYRQSEFERLPEGNESALGSPSDDFAFFNCFDKISDPDLEEPEKPMGYMLTKWKLFGQQITFANLNLYSQESLFLSGAEKWQTSCSAAAAVRKDQIKDLVDRIGQEGARVIAGAYNSQLDQDALLKDLAAKQNCIVDTQKDDDGEIRKLQYTDDNGIRLVTVESNKFDLHHYHDWYFTFARGEMVRKYNKELSAEHMEGFLEENIYFPPTRYYGETLNCKSSLQRNLCPAWADRILYDPVAFQMMRHNQFSSSSLYYGLIGPKTEMGQCKPVALHATLAIARKRRDSRGERQRSNSSSSSSSSCSVDV